MNNHQTAARVVDFFSSLTLINLLLTCDKPFRQYIQSKIVNRNIMHKNRRKTYMRRIDYATAETLIIFVSSTLIYKILPLKYQL